MFNSVAAVIMPDELILATLYTSVPVPTQPQIPSPTAPQMTLEQKRDAYKNILGETAASFTSNDAQTFRPNPGMDMANGALPEGNLGMNQIMGLLNKK